MTTSVDIANRALSAISARTTIANFDLEQSVEAKQARLLYAPTRDALLRAAHWEFARRTAYLSLLKSAPGTPENPTSATEWDPATMPAPPWLYEYAYPSDCLLLRYVTPAPALASDTISPPLFSVTLPGTTSYGVLAVPFQRATDVIDGSPVGVVLTNAREAVGCYTMRVEVEDLWDPAFQEAMVAALAARLATALTGNMEIFKLQAQMAVQQLRTAQASNGNEGTTTTDHTPDWIRARGCGGVLPGRSCVMPWVMPSFLGA